MKNVRFIICAVLIVLTGCQTKATPTPFVGSGWAKIGDIIMYFEGTGTGKPMIILSTVLSCIDYLSKQVEAFSEEYNVIVPESRGQCRTTGMDTEINYHIWAEDTIKLMDHLGIDKAYVIGIKEGANIAIDMAINHPDRLFALVTLEANMNPRKLDQKWLDTLKSLSIEELTNYEDLPQFAYWRSGAENVKSFVEKIRTLWMTEPNFTEEQMASIKLPMLIIAGNYDFFIQHEHHQEIADIVSNSQLVIIPAVSAHILDTASDTFNQTVMDFLKDK